MHELSFFLMGIFLQQEAFWQKIQNARRHGLPRSERLRYAFLAGTFNLDGNNM